MSNVNSLRINKLPSKTWNWLKMNDTQISWPEMPYESSRELRDIPSDGVICDENIENDIKKIKSGIGEEFDELVEESQVKRETIYIESNRTIEKPIKINLTYENKQKCINTFEICVSENSSATIIMEYVSDEEVSCSAAIQVKVYTEKNSHIKLIQADLMGKNSVFINDIGIKSDDKASIEIDQFFLGGGKRYSGCNSDLTGDKSNININLFYLGRDEQLLDMNYNVCHKGKKTNSKINASGILNDRSFKLFRGTIDFKKGSSGSVGSEKEEVLLTGDEIVNQTIPLILCEEEDVEGNHGATIGQLDEEILFYIGSRGIDKESAYKMIADAKMESVLKNVENIETANKIREYMSGIERNANKNE